jgi:hypothetical protein
MCSWHEVRDHVRSRPGRYHEVVPPRTKAKDPSPLKVKQVRVGEHRYVVCFNVEQPARPCLRPCDSRRPHRPRSTRRRKPVLG